MGETKILITGGAGFIGSLLAKKLAFLGNRVVVLDNLSKQIHGERPIQTSYTFKNVIHSNIEFVEGDIKNLDLLKKLVKDCNIIYHMAAETGTGQSMYEISKYSEVNIHGTSLLFQAISDTKDHKIEKIIYASSRSIYGEGKYENSEGKIFYPDHRQLEKLKKGDFGIYNEKELLKPIPTDEDSKIHPSSFYGLTKYIQEKIIHTLSKQFDIIPISLRLQNVYGEGQSLINPYTGIISIFSSLLMANDEINVFEDGFESRDFIHVEDVVEAFILMKSELVDSEKIYNVGFGKEISVLEVAETLKKLFDSKSKINISGAFRVGDIRTNFADISKITDELSYKPKIEFNEGISRFVKWVKSKEKQSISLKESLNEMKGKGLFNE